MATVSDPDPDHDRVATFKRRYLGGDGWWIDHVPRAEVELLLDEAERANRAAAQLAAEAARERDARAALGVHVTELERRVRDLEAELVAARRGPR